MHPEIQRPNPGTCPKCGMDLVLRGTTPEKPRRTLKDFSPLIVIFAVILVLTGFMVWRQSGFEIFYAMRMFEGFFFIIFATFKLLNLKGFADAYGTYDIIAKHSRPYAYAYPFIELALGLGYLFDFQVLLVSVVTLVLMIIGVIGVAREIRKKRQIQCACLGVVFKLPMTWVTLTEDLIMAGMAVAMIGMIFLQK
jgi:hypothetical protein